MKRCRRCQHPGLDMVREAVTRRGRREYTVSWYRCPGCHEVSLSYRRVQQPPRIEMTVSNRVEERTPAGVTASLDADPALSR